MTRRNRVGTQASIALAVLTLSIGCGPRSSGDTLLEVEGGADSEVRYSDREALPPPPPLPDTAPDRAYLESIASRLQPAWSSFLEDCRTRLAAEHALNDPSLETSLLLVLRPDGTIIDIRSEKASGNEEFDAVALEVASDLGAVDAPPRHRVSDDDRVYLGWRFARDQRQAGPVQASWQSVTLPLEEALPKLLAGGQIGIAAARLKEAALPAADIETYLQELADAVVAAGLASNKPVEQVLALRGVAHGKLKARASEARALVGSAEAEVAIAAIDALAAIGDSDDIERLSNLALDAPGVNPSVRAAAARALATFGRSDDAADQATANLRSENEEKRRAACAVLATLPAASAVPALIAILERGGQTTREERSAAVVALGRQARETGKATKALLTGSTNADAAIRAASMEAIASAARAGMKNRIAYWRALELLKDRDERVRAASISAAAALDPARFAAELAKIRAGGSKQVIGSLAEVLGVVPGPVSLARLLDLAAISDTTMRVWAAKGLKLRSEAEAKAAMERLVADASPEVRVAAIGSTTSDETLRSLLEDGSPRVQARALAALTRRGGRANTAGVLVASLARPGAGAETRLLWIAAWLGGGE